MRFALSILLLMVSVASAQTTRPNILLLMADDMNYDTPGFAGNALAGVTPNLDKLAAEGMYFKQARVTVAVCQPSRSVLMTGRYPHRNGAVGFNPINDDVPTLGERLHAAGYLNGIFAKVPHMAPVARFKWDTIVQAPDLGQGRDPKKFYEHAKAFFEEAKTQNKPFFLNANSQDPHRPWPGTEGESRAARQGRAGKFPGVSKTYAPADVTVPPFLPDLPEVRAEMAAYYTGAHRCDEAMGEVLRALDESGLKDNTLVMFLSDNGISQPFAKSNCYFNSNRTPWLVRWPGKVKAGQVDDKHFISGIDFLPTVLEAAGLPAEQGVDGRSFLPIATGQAQQPERDHVVTVYHITSGDREYPMRSISNADYTYIFNAWSDGKTAYQSEAMGGNTFNAMRKAGATDPAIAERVKLLQFRVPEEFYDLKNDADALHNLVADPRHRDQIMAMKKQLLGWMEQTKDPLRETFAAHLAARDAAH